MDPKDWHGVASAKLTKVLGEAAGTATMRSVLEELGTSRIESAADLRRFSVALRKRGGFSMALAALLDVHAATHG